MGGSDHCYFFGFSSDRNVFTANINDINLVETRTVLVLANFGCLPFAKSFGKSGGKVIGTRLFGWIERKICRSNGTSEKYSCFSGGNVANGNSCSTSSIQSFQACLDVFR